VAFGCELSHAALGLQSLSSPCPESTWEEVLDVGLQIFQMDAVILGFCLCPQGELRSKCIERFDAERQIQVFTHLAAEKAPLLATS